MAFLPDGDAVVTERDTAKVLLIGGDAPYEVTEIGTIGEAAPQGEGGLLGVAVSPTFDRDRLLYFYFSSDTDNRIVTATYDKGGLSKLKPILTGIPLGGIHDGGRIAFGPDGFLYASTGETGDPGSPRTRRASAARSCGSPRRASRRRGTRSATRSTRSATATSRVSPGPTTTSCGPRSSGRTPSTS